VNSLFARLAASRFLRFALVGGFGFVVAEATLLLALRVGADKYSAWIVQFLCAATFTWWGNRHLTFGDRRAHGTREMFLEWLKFLGANAIGGAANAALYATLVTWAPQPLALPVIALACGVLTGLALNFTMSNLFVFGR